MYTDCQSKYGADLSERSILACPWKNASSDPKVHYARIIARSSKADGDNSSSVPQPGSKPEALVTGEDPEDVPEKGKEGEVDRDSDGSFDDSRRLAAGDEPVYSLLCMTTPQALDKSKAPFT
ncbi:hypothetical protein Efla_004315 [Eimeria flavescens]